jgi:hypothetical protein
MKMLLLWESYGGQCNCGARKHLYQWKVITRGTGWKKHIFFVIKPTRCTDFTNLFCHETLHVSDSSSGHHQEFIHCTLSNGICHKAFEQDQDGTSWSWSKAVYKPVWNIPLLSVQWINSWWWTEELSETWQNKFLKLVHIVGFITKKRQTILFHTWLAGLQKRTLKWSMTLKFTLCTVKFPLY